jgi:GNAT superfamily N-acetyltransferase
MGRLSAREREYATLVAQLDALREDVEAARATARAAEHQHIDLHHRALSTPQGNRVTLADGGEIVIRPIAPGDREELAAGFRHLGALTRYRSLGEPGTSLTPRQLASLTEIDHSSHEALVALDTATGEGVGIARYVRHRDDPAWAELACTVTDTWQRRGVGSALMDRLAARARAAGITHFLAHAVVGDEPARRLLGHVANHITEQRDGGIVELSAETKPS